MITTVNEQQKLLNSVRLAPDLDELFAPHPSGYTGADVGLSIPLPDGRILWVFGDTLVGSCAPGARSWDSMPKNTIAIQPPGASSGTQIQWHITDKAGKPQTYFRLPANAEGEWFWPGTGCVLNHQLFIFGYGVVSAESDCEALAFRVVRGWMFQVPDISGDPETWRYTCTPVEWKPNCIFSSACIQSGEYLCLSGIELCERSAGVQSPAILARVSVAQLCKAHELRPEFWTTDASWSRDAIAQLQPLFHPRVTECSIYYDEPRGRYLATTYTGRNPEFLITSAPALTGPWSVPTTLYCCNDAHPPANYLFYTFRMHPHLTTDPDEMVMSYVVNAREPAELERNTSIYFPRFIRVDLREI
jgi:hypothetical protein